jgi:chaperonin GroES
VEEEAAKAIVDLMTVKVGDKVAFSKYGYEEISMKGEDYFLIKEDSILAVLKKI